MHQRISERRRQVHDANLAVASSDEVVPTSVKLLEVEARLVELAKVVRDVRLARALSVMKSTRLIVEMVESSGGEYSTLMPCAAAAMREVQADIGLIIREAQPQKSVAHSPEGKNQ